jgi:hypothetical protein
MSHNTHLEQRTTLLQDQLEEMLEHHQAVRFNEEAKDTFE